MKGWLNAPDGKAKKKKKKLNIDTRLLTLEEGQQLVAEHDAVDQAKAEEKKVVAVKKVLKAVERQWLHDECSPDELFVGSLSMKSLPDLLDIITILKLLDEGSRMLKWNIVRCYSDLKLNISTRNCIGSLRSQDLCK